MPVAQRQGRFRPALAVTVTAHRGRTGRRRSGCNAGVTLAPQRPLKHFSQSSQHPSIRGPIGTGVV